MRRFALRKVIGGQVKINGSYYKPYNRPDDLPYNNELEGLVLAFGLYRGDNKMVSLWGDEKLYKSVNDDIAYKKAYENQPNVTSQGLIMWEWWYKV